jgi:hypothetical protein
MRTFRYMAHLLFVLEERADDHLNQPQNSLFKAATYSRSVAESRILGLVQVNYGTGTTTMANSLSCSASTSSEGSPVILAASPAERVWSPRRTRPDATYKYAP